MIPLSPARPRALVTKCVVPPRAKTVPTIFFYFGARSRNNYLQIVRDLGMVRQGPFFRYGRERAAAATLTYYSNNVRENEVNAPSRAKDVLYKISFDGPFQ